MQLPDPSLLNKMHLALDCAFMLHMRGVHQDLLSQAVRPALCLLADSSPQGGVDWENVEYWLVAGSNIAQWFSATGPAC
jgi:hypothetical protein